MALTFQGIAIDTDRKSVTTNHRMSRHAELCLRRQLYSIASKGVGNRFLFRIRCATEQSWLLGCWLKRLVCACSMTDRADVQLTPCTLNTQSNSVRNAFVAEWATGFVYLASESGLFRMPLDGGSETEPVMQPNDNVDFTIGCDCVAHLC